LKALSTGQIPANDLLPSDPAFTPTGKGKITISGVSVVTETGMSGAGSLPSQIGPTSNPSYSNSGHRLPAREPMSRASIIGYAIGVAGFAIALIVLFLLRR